MFGKKCFKCRRKISRGFDFCPYCGYNVKREREEKDYGLLGKDDEIEFPGFGMRMPFGFNRIFNSLLKQVDKEFKELDKQMGKETKKPEEKFPKIKSRGISISISAGTGRKPEIRIGGFGPEFEELKQSAKVIPKTKISEEKAKQLAKLPREEAETQVRRLSNKVIYEINMPGVSSLKDIVINKLENSIEIKAFSKDKVYVKLLPVSLPVLNYKLEDEKLILELKARD